MVKAPIKDPSIGIKPSGKLIDFIKSLDNPSIDLPKNLLKVYEAFTQDGQKRKIYRQQISSTPILTGEEKHLLMALSKDTFQNSTDLQKCLESLSLHQDDHENNSSSEIEEIVGNGERISKNKARQLRAKQREKELSKYMLNLSDLKWLHQYLLDTRKTDDSSICYLHELIEGSQLILPSNEYTERNPELEERCIRLRREQDDQRYRSMTKNVDNSRSFEPEETISYQVKQINRQLIAVLQFIFSVAAGFAFGFIGIELLVGDLDFGFRLLLGIICSLTIALAEIYFLAKKLNEEIDEAEQATRGPLRNSNTSTGSRVQQIREHND